MEYLLGTPYVTRLYERLDPAQLQALEPVRSSRSTSTSASSADHGCGSGSSTPDAAPGLANGRAAVATAPARAAPHRTAVSLAAAMGLDAEGNCITDAAAAATGGSAARRARPSSLQPLWAGSAPATTPSTHFWDGLRGVLPCSDDGGNLLGTAASQSARVEYGVATRELAGKYVLVYLSPPRTATDLTVELADIRPVATPLSTTSSTWRDRVAGAGGAASSARDSPLSRRATSGTPPTSLHAGGVAAPPARSAAGSPSSHLNDRTATAVGAEAMLTPGSRMATSKQKLLGFYCLLLHQLQREKEAAEARDAEEDSETEKERAGGAARSEAPPAENSAAAGDEELTSRTSSSAASSAGLFWHDRLHRSVIDAPVAVLEVRYAAPAAQASPFASATVGSAGLSDVSSVNPNGVMPTVPSAASVLTRNSASALSATLPTPAVREGGAVAAGSAVTGLSAWGSPLLRSGSVSCASTDELPLSLGSGAAAQGEGCSGGSSVSRLLAAACAPVMLAPSRAQRIGGALQQLLEGRLDEQVAPDSIVFEESVTANPFYGGWMCVTSTDAYRRIMQQCGLCHWPSVVLFDPAGNIATLLALEHLEREVEDYVSRAHTYCDALDRRRRADRCSSPLLDDSTDDEDGQEEADANNNTNNNLSASALSNDGYDLTLHTRLSKSSASPSVVPYGTRQLRDSEENARERDRCASSSPPAGGSTAGTGVSPSPSAPRAERGVAAGAVDGADPQALDASIPVVAPLEPSAAANARDEVESSSATLSSPQLKRDTTQAMLSQHSHQQTASFRSTSLRGAGGSSVAEDGLSSGVYMAGPHSTGLEASSVSATDAQVPTAEPSPVKGVPRTAGFEDSAAGGERRSESGASVSAAVQRPRLSTSVAHTDTTTAPSRRRATHAQSPAPHLRSAFPWTNLLATGQMLAAAAAAPDEEPAGAVAADDTGRVGRAPPLTEDDLACPSRGPLAAAAPTVPLHPLVALASLTFEVGEVLQALGGSAGGGDDGGSPPAGAQDAFSATTHVILFFGAGWHPAQSRAVASLRRLVGSVNARSSRAAARRRAPAKVPSDVDAVPSADTEAAAPEAEADIRAVPSGFRCNDSACFPVGSALDRGSGDDDDFCCGGISGGLNVCGLSGKFELPADGDDGSMAASSDAGDGAQSSARDDCVVKVVYLSADEDLAALQSTLREMPAEWRCLTALELPSLCAEGGGAGPWTPGNHHTNGGDDALNKGSTALERADNGANRGSVPQSGTHSSAVSARQALLLELNRSACGVTAFPRLVVLELPAAHRPTDGALAASAAGQSVEDPAEDFSSPGPQISSLASVLRDTTTDPSVLEGCWTMPQSHGEVYLLTDPTGKGFPWPDAEKERDTFMEVTHTGLRSPQKRLLGSPPYVNGSSRAAALYPREPLPGVRGAVPADAAAGEVTGGEADGTARAEKVAAETAGGAGVPPLLPFSAERGELSLLLERGGYFVVLGAMGPVDATAHARCAETLDRARQWFYTEVEQQKWKLWEESDIVLASSYGAATSTLGSDHALLGGVRSATAASAGSNMQVRQQQPRVIQSPSLPCSPSTFTSLGSTVVQTDWAGQLPALARDNAALGNVRLPSAYFYDAVFSLPEDAAAAESSGADASGSQQPALHHTADACDEHRADMALLQEYVIAPILEQDERQLPARVGELFLACVRLPHRTTAVLRRLLPSELPPPAAAPATTAAAAGYTTSGAPSKMPSPSPLPAPAPAAGAEPAPPAAADTAEPEDAPVASPSGRVPSAAPVTSSAPGGFPSPGSGASSASEASDAADGANGGAAAADASSAAESADPTILPVASLEMVKQFLSDNVLALLVNMEEC